MLLNFDSIKADFECITAAAAAPRLISAAYGPRAAGPETKTRAEVEATQAGRQARAASSINEGRRQARRAVSVGKGGEQ